MTERELDAAGITDPALRRAYAQCRAINAEHGRTYFLATRLLPASRRPDVHALYGFARWADDIVDDLSQTVGHAERATRLDNLSRHLKDGLRTGHTDTPVLKALVHTATRHDIVAEHFTDFLDSMRSDLTTTEYATYDELRRYMHGSAAVIGLQMLPVLGTVVPREEAAPHAAALGVAFQLTNFLRDVGEDLGRGRIYLPGDLLSAHGVDRRLLEWSRETGRADRRITTALRAAEDLTRSVYREAAPGLAILDPVSRPCIRTALVLYSGILYAIAENGYAVLRRRAVVPRRRRAAVALGGLARATAARYRGRRPHRSATVPGGPGERLDTAPSAGTTGRAR